jgi:NADH:ubiquinone oxidoreductase subunit E
MLTKGSEDMHGMFEFPIRRTYELLMEQWQRARANKVKIKVCTSTTCHVILGTIDVSTNIYTASFLGRRLLRVTIHVR